MQCIRSYVQCQLVPTTISKGNVRTRVFFKFVYNFIRTQMKPLVNWQVKLTIK